MKKLLFFSLLFLAMPQITNASVNVNISNSEGTNKVNVDSNTSTNVSQSKSSNITTNVVIDQNGEKKEFHTTNGEDVKYKSPDGNTTVNINNNSTGTNTSTSNSTYDSSVHIISNNNSDDSTKSATPSADVLGVKEEVKQENQDLMNWIKNFFENLSNIFKH